MSEPRDDLGTEVHRLVTAVQDWARSAFPDPASGTAAAGTGDGCLPWCPICQFANILRGEHPEITERLAEAGTALAAAMKALTEAAVNRAQPDADEPARPRPAPRVERIRLDDPHEA